MKASLTRPRAWITAALLSTLIGLVAAAAGSHSRTSTGSGIPRLNMVQAPKCSRASARALIPTTAVGRRFIGPLDAVPWTITQLGCLRLMGGRTDMVALATCCTAASPTPLFIFRPSGSSWRLAYARNGPLITKIAHRGGAVIEKRPVYHPSTPLCCAAGYTYWSLRYRGGRWVTTRTADP